MKDKKQDNYEMIAKIILEDYFNICNLSKEESPDWQDKINHIGIEVTATQEGTAFFAELERVKKPIPNDKIKKFNKRFEKNGGRILDLKTARIIFGYDKDSLGLNENYFYIIPGYNDDFSRVNKAINIKLKKLNKNYNSEITDNRLFIFTPIWANREMIEKELETIKNIQKKYLRFFNIIYISISNYIYIFDMNSNKWNSIKVDIDKVNAKLVKLYY